MNASALSYRMWFLGRGSGPARFETIVGRFRLASLVWPAWLKEYGKRKCPGTISAGDKERTEVSQSNWGWSSNSE
ncbi:hypothetical protein VTJ04DRAFT_822 [Mycothermus thermophilus]|uniref:uncharacterized protein n=1 Tax=Humicola insolens TaxID=85995 RepID=UPI003743B1C2